MKKTIAFFCAVILISGFNLSAGELTFDEYKEILSNAAPEGFTLDESRSRGSKFNYTVVFIGDKSKMETLTFSFFPGKEDFTSADLAGDLERGEVQGRKAIFKEGSVSSPSSLVIILDEKAGRIEVKHRVFGKKPKTSSELAEVFSDILLEDLEK
jgi:hypothetical protein